MARVPAVFVKRERDYNAHGHHHHHDKPLSTEAADRRALRSRYLSVKNQLILDEGDDITRLHSVNFDSIFREVQTLHERVQKPREQVADAEALLDITRTLFTSAKSESQGVTVSDFISSLAAFASSNSSIKNDIRNSLDWKKIGRMVANDFRSHPRLCTMIGPMSIEPKKRRTHVRRKILQSAKSAVPENVDESEKKTDTDKNMSTMFDILRQKRRVRLEDLVLNRDSFAQTVENVFALSFLVKDGRAEIVMDGNNSHHISPRNAPIAAAVASKEVVYNHFVFRFDYQDWKLMKSLVKEGSELMPPRIRRVDEDGTNKLAAEPTRETTRLPPARKLCSMSNNGLVLQSTPQQRSFFSMPPS